LVCPFMHDPSNQLFPDQPMCERHFAHYDPWSTRRCSRSQASAQVADLRHATRTKPAPGPALNVTRLFASWSPGAGRQIGEGPRHEQDPCERDQYFWLGVSLGVMPGHER
jgi:hypothetical protein